MRCWWNILWLTLILLLLLGNTAYTRRTGRRRSSRRRSSSRQRPVQQEQVPVNAWRPDHVIQQTQIRFPTDGWEPERVVQQTDTGTLELWRPTQQESQVPEDAWLPETIHTPQLEGTIQQQVPVRGRCSFIYDEVPEEFLHPLLVNPKTKEFVYPDKVGEARVLEVPADSTLIAACPGTRNSLKDFRHRYITLKCKRGSLTYRRKPVPWSKLGCNDKPDPTIKNQRGCGRRRGKSTIGWNIRKGLFVPQITLCFDQLHETALYEVHQVHGRYIDAKMVDSSRPGFKALDMFSVRVSDSYTKKTQKSTVAGLLNTTDHLTSRRQHYLARGHLAPDADFVLEAEQDATYYYVNVVPQWQAINNGNWKILEGEVRELAERRQSDLEVYTGTHGTLELPDTRNNPVKLYLGQAFQKEVVPVPALMWKVIHDPVRHSAVGIVMVNDVRGRGTSSSWRLGTSPCPNLCRSLSWVTWDTTDTSRGRTFCCTVDALRRTIPEVPFLGNVALLRN